MDTADAIAPPRQQTPSPVRASGVLFVAYAIAAAFSVYFCMYAFRKPFDAVLFKDMYYPGTLIQLKTACVIAQIIGYLCSKYLGSKFCTEVRAGRRALVLIGLIVVAEFGLLLFAVLPIEWKPLGMFINGLPLGMVWGLAVRYLEGRRSSETLVAGMSTAFIIAGAATRDIGVNVVMDQWHFAEPWMPLVTGALFFVPFVAAVCMLDRVPPPSAADQAARAPRVNMDARRRWQFLSFFGWGFVLVVVAYFFLTAFRDFRDHYGMELFKELGLGGEMAIFSRTEQWAMFAAILVMAGFSLIANHRTALIMVYLVIAGGFALIGLATFAYQNELVSGYVWMAAVGVGLYLAYVPYGAILFERMMAASRFAGTSVFAIQLADGIGYTGSVLLQIYRDVYHGNIGRLAFIIPYSYVVSAVGVVLVLASAVLTLRRIR